MIKNSFSIVKYNNKMSSPTNQKLYAKVKAEADKKFLAPTSAYKSGWIVKTYKERGGTYSPAILPKDTTGLKRWFAEKWIDLNRSGQPCGRKKADTPGKYPLCRPSVKVTSKTPKMAQEIPTDRIQRANKDKQKGKRVKF